MLEGRYDVTASRLIDRDGRRAAVMELRGVVGQTDEGAPVCMEVETFDIVAATSLNHAAARLRIRFDFGADALPATDPTGRRECDIVMGRVKQ